MRTAIVGLGVIGKVHVSVLKELGAEIVAVCDCDEDKLKQYPEISGYVDYEKMLDEVRPDIVHICTPHYLHTEMILAALKRDINVLCEKPMCIKEEDIPLILEAEKDSKAQLGICFQNRYTPANMYVKEYLQDKKLIGATGIVAWNRNKEYYNSASWRGKWKTEGGGALINQVIHTLDLLQWLCGMPKEVYASTANLTLTDTIEVEDTATILCRKEDGTGFNLFATNASCVGFPVELILRTETETVRVTPNAVIIGDQVASFKNDTKIYGKKSYGSGHKTLIQDFYDCVESRRAFPINGEEGAKSIRILSKAYKN